ncbi:hypothetical protein AB0Q95_26020 [Streptomyces sp. NPDC059900]|uniref:hypothetical protein n=1 Tax=Streptomyces sp. NPDC059900 TaxID=3155816 RepID=UPI0034156800
MRLGTRYVAPGLRPADRQEQATLKALAPDAAGARPGAGPRLVALAIESASGGVGLVLCSRVRALRGGSDPLGDGGTGESELLWSHPPRKWDIPEEILARSVFGPLGGIVEIGAVAATGTWDLADVSVREFVSRRQGDITRLLEVVQEVGGFGEPVMGIFDDLGYAREHPVEAPSLLLWSSGYEEVSDRFDQPDAVRRMSRVGADLQLTRFLDAMVEAAIAHGTDVARGAPLIAEALQIAVVLVGPALDGAHGDVTALRMWRVAHLAGLLLPDSPAAPEARALFRDYGHALDAVLGAP